MYLDPGDRLVMGHSLTMWFIVLQPPHSQFGSSRTLQSLKLRLHDTAGCQSGCQTGLYNRFDNGFDNRLYRVYKHLPGCQTGLTTGLTTGCIV